MRRGARQSGRPRLVWDTDSYGAKPAYGEGEVGVEFVSLEGVLALGLLWIAFKATVTVLLLLGAGRLLRRTPLAPLVARMEAHLPAVQLRSRPPWIKVARSRHDPPTRPDAARDAEPDEPAPRHIEGGQRERPA